MKFSLALISTGIISAAIDSKKQANTLLAENGSILDRVQYPRDIKNFSIDELELLSDEIRLDVVNTVVKTGGHLSSSLGVADLTVALHYVFNTPHDRIVWDVAHQTYPHKILTGRRSRMHTLRKFNGLSGFTKREESEFDPFGAGHSSTSISAVHGMYEAKKLLHPTEIPHCIAVIGDGAITGGMAFEALNSAGDLKSRIIVILNDNGEVSLPTGMATKAGTGAAGALSAFLSRSDISRRGGGFFRAFNADYIGPVDGHDMEELIDVLMGVRDNRISPGDHPVVIHLKTIKGKGFEPAIKASDKMHGVSAGFDLVTGKAKASATPSPPALTKIFAEELIEMAKVDPTITAITAAMPGGTGVGDFGKIFPNRAYDVGIAEQHAVTMAGGMAAEGSKPFVAIYSTFLQRAYDSVIHDVALQSLPVRFVIDRAGLVGQDGATHQGLYDLAFLSAMVGFGVIMAPSDQIELRRMVRLMGHLNDTPSAVRYPRGNGYSVEDLKEHCGHETDEQETMAAIAIGKARVVRTVLNEHPENCAVKLGILSLGSRLLDVSKALYSLEDKVSAWMESSRRRDSVSASEKSQEEEDLLCYTLVDMRFMQPLDKEMIRKVHHQADLIFTLEEGVKRGGFGSSVLEFLMEDDDHLHGRHVPVHVIGLPSNVVIEGGNPEEQLHLGGVSKAAIEERMETEIKKWMDRHLRI
eukprot:GDKJ01040218.1.p1 GENE.GDKJ01040218.1~~GDKJ01040218.1.p1  ORF type:complete len:711 (-),score=144.62 GDKJ01040218.1:137-2224(-)